MEIRYHNHFIYDSYAGIFEREHMIIQEYINQDITEHIYYI